MLLTRELLQTVAEIAQRAGAAIMEVYTRSESPEVLHKADNSPLTQADMQANALIVDALKTLSPHLPVLSEESPTVPFEQRRLWQQYWLVDPLDGTREFLSRNGEFTVNIALIDNGAPVLGVVLVPVTGVIYAGFCGEGAGAWRVDSAGNWQAITCAKLPDPAYWGQYSLRVVSSRRHGEAELASMLAGLSQRFAGIVRVPMGSSLKICLLAEGAADFYPRLAPTSEWDTAAAHAVLRAAGGEIYDLSLNPLVYNRKSDMLNPYFLATADMSTPWLDLLNELKG